MNTEFHKINLNEWNRAQYFYYFTKMLPTGYSLTSNIDITQAYNAIKNKGKKFFPAYLYICSKIISEENEFRIGYLNEDITKSFIHLTLRSIMTINLFQICGLNTMLTLKFSIIIILKTKNMRVTMR